jgi:hypothetical protein
MKGHVKEKNESLPREDNGRHEGLVKRDEDRSSSDRGISRENDACIGTVGRGRGGNLKH